MFAALPDSAFRRIAAVIAARVPSTRKLTVDPGVLALSAPRVAESAVSQRMTGFEGVVLP